MLLQFDPKKHIKVYHRKHGTNLIMERVTAEKFMNASHEENFTCYRIGENEWISTLKVYSFPKEELSLKPVVNTRTRSHIKK